MRYQLNKGKFGCYFYDSKIEIDMSLDMVLNKLNQNEILINKLKDKIYIKEAIKP